MTFHETLLVTGGAGFIGSNFVLAALSSGSTVVNLDALTYAGNLGNLAAVSDDARHIFVQGDINDRELVERLLAKHRPSAIVHFAAESHVDRSIAGPEAFLKTNIDGTFTLLRAARAYFDSLSKAERGGEHGAERKGEHGAERKGEHGAERKGEHGFEGGAERGGEKERFRFLHVSTDEVYGTLGPDDAAFHEGTPYAPNSPYAASKASSDLLVRAWVHTYGLPALITNCSNNYGPFQFPEKLIPLMILNALAGKPLPVYGDGQQIRDWLYVADHCSAIQAVLANGRIGETYNIGGGNQRANLVVVETVCALLDELRPESKFVPHRQLIQYVQDRPGHDRRYAIDARKIESELGWKAAESFETGLRKTVEWYLDHSEWLEDVTSGSYQQWVTRNYAARTGEAATSYAVAAVEAGAK